MNLIEIADWIKAKEEKEKKREEEKKGNNNSKTKQIDDFWEPVEATEYTLPTVRIPQTRTKACTKAALSKVLAFIHLVEHKRLAHGCTIMPIPETERRLLSITGSQQNSSNLIALMIYIGLISAECKQYRFGTPKKKGNRSKTYRYYYDNEQIIKKYCEDNNINVYQPVKEIPKEALNNQPLPEQFLV